MIQIGLFRLNCEWSGHVVTVTVAAVILQLLSDWVLGSTLTCSSGRNILHPALNRKQYEQL